MKKYLFLSMILMMAGCSLPEQYPTAPLDTEAVRIYNAKVHSGNTVSAKQKKRVIKEAEMPLNESDKRENQRNSRHNIILMPSVGYYHHYPHHSYYW